MTLLIDSFFGLMDLLDSLGIVKQVVSSLALLVAYWVFRGITILTIRRWNAPSPEGKRRWIIQIKNVSLIILAAGLFGIWATELRAFALSLVAVAAAIAIATKDVIQSFLGGFYKSSSRAFELRDRIEVAGYRGEVIDHNFLSTTLLEIGPGHEMHQLSGRQVVIPNSLFLFHPVLNQTLQQHFLLQSIRVVLAPGEDWKAVEKIMLEVALRECSDFLEGARHSMMRLGQREGLDLPRVEPRVFYSYDEQGSLCATLRFPCPIDRVSRTEQAIMKGIVEARGVPNIGYPLGR